MAEYYPLLARAVAGMRSAPAEQRKAIYDRARQALLGQLRSMQPAVPEESINRESTALDEAIARIEAELAVAVQPAPVASAEPALVAEPIAPAPVAAAPSRSPGAPPKTAERPPVAPPPPSFEPTPPRPTPAAPPPVLPQPRLSGPVSRPPGARPAAEALSRIVAERETTPVPLRPPRIEASAPPRPDTGGKAAALPTAPRLHVPSFADALEMAEGKRADEASGEGETQSDAVVAQPTAETVLRPPAPRPVTRKPFNPRVLILTLVGLLVVAGIGYTAWRLRDKPEALARSRAALLAAQQAEQANSKVSTRADAGAPVATGASSSPAASVAAPPQAPVAANAPGASSAPVITAPTTPDVTPAAPADISSAATPAPAPSAPAPAAAPPSSSTAMTSPSPATQASSAANLAPTPTAQNATIPVAQRAAFLVEAPDDPQKIKTYVGTVLWSEANSTPGQQDQPIARTVHADVNVPEAGLKLAMVFQKNEEPQFPASHTLELHFTLEPSSTIGSIKQINVPQMRKDESPTGEALTGLPVTITDNYFLVGLSRGDATARNLDLIKSRNWFDIPVLLGSGRVAKITFEKGTTGQKAIDDVLQTWQ